MGKLLEDLAEVSAQADSTNNGWVSPSTAKALQFIRTHHANIAQNAIDAANYKAAFERCRDVCNATAEGWREDSKRLKALEQAISDFDGMSRKENRCGEYIHHRADEIMRGGE